MTTRNGYAQRTGPVEAVLDSSNNITSIRAPGVGAGQVVSITDMASLTKGNAFTGNQSFASGAVSLNTASPTAGAQLTIASSGAGANQFGLRVEAQSGATNNYAVHLNNAAASNVWNVYAPGTAGNHFAGNVGIGPTAPTERLSVTGTTNDGTALTSFVQSGTGRGLYVLRSVAAATRALVSISQASATGGSQHAVHIQQADSGKVALGVSTDGSTATFTVTSTGGVTATSVTSTGAVRVGTFTVATVPSASGSGAGAAIYVSDEIGGAVLAFSDGTNWRRCTDRAIVS